MESSAEDIKKIIKEEFEKQARLLNLKKERSRLKKQIQNLNESFGDESGYYAPGTEFDSNSPWNQDDVEMVECYICDGTGVDPESGEECWKCNGTGVIEDDRDKSDVDPFDYHDRD